ncbi:MAG: hypothetical protein R2867_38620 [Caldilineaceae bacterium]
MTAATGDRHCPRTAAQHDDLADDVPLDHGRDWSRFWRMATCWQLARPCHVHLCCGLFAIPDVVDWHSADPRASVRWRIFPSGGMYSTPPPIEPTARFLDLLLARRCRFSRWCL